MATDNPSEDMIMDEIIRSKVRKFVDEPPPKTRSERFYAHPLAAATITFIFTALFAGAVGYYFNLKQKAFEESLARERQEMDHRHQEQQSEFQRAREDAKAESDHREKQIEDQVSFARDLQKNYFGQAGTLTLEMSKTKVDKLAEVWGHLSRYEGALRELLELKVMASEDHSELYEPMEDAPQRPAAGASDAELAAYRKKLQAWEADNAKLRSAAEAAIDEASKQQVARGFELMDESIAHWKKLLTTLDNNRFWIDDESYNAIKEYAVTLKDSQLGALDRIDKASLASKPISLEEAIRPWKKKLSKERASVAKIRDSVLRDLRKVTGSR